ncbi:AMP-binding protein [Phenylobacterium sp.]|uniref:AMP-binding protein n=1 Tax=Phenylobacterium sp. TaxID=1871053 RepID=UPI002FC8B392
MGEALNATLDLASGFAPKAVDISYREDGSLILRSPIALTECRGHLCEYLPAWAAEAPTRTFLAERGASGEWRRVTYADAWRRVRAIAQALLARDLTQDQPVAILTGNSIEHALITFAGMAAGVPVAPISPAYSLHPEGLGRLAGIAEILKPAMVFVQNTRGLDRVRTIPGLANAEWVSVEADPTATSFAALEMNPATAEVDTRLCQARPDDVAKILFTSGSTGTPKGVPQTQRMLCNAIHSASLLILDHEPPVVVDWMPWHHTMGGNNTLHGILRDGGSLYIDDGRPTPELIGRTIRNLKEIPVTFAQNVPAGIQMLVEAMEQDSELRTSFFSRIRRLLYAGAALPRDTWERLQALSLATSGRPVPVTSGYGTTETAPGICSTYWACEGRGEIGLPHPGVEVKLVPAGDRYEIRARGPNVMPGYLGRPDLNEAAFDEEGFYKVGDAVTFVDPLDPRAGLRFAGRLSENFKLSNGSWVITGELRSTVIAAAPAIAEAVVAGQDRDDVRLLVWAAPIVRADLVRDGMSGESLEAALRARIADELRAYNDQNAGATRRIKAFAVLKEPPSLGAGEVTDKGNVNQRAVLASQADLVADLYASKPSERVAVL